MKFFAVLALAAVAFAEPEAEAEADPALLYSAYGFPYAGVYGGYRTYGAYPYSYYGKRSADAAPAADTPSHAHHGAGIRGQSASGYGYGYGYYYG